MDTIQSVRERRGLQLRNWLSKICEAGTDSLSFFGGGYTHEGGLALQQNPDEFAAAVTFLEAEMKPSPLGGPPLSYLEIGSASGGTCRFLVEALSICRAWVIDDHGHWRWPEQQANFDAIDDQVFGSRPLGIATVQPWVGNSASRACRQWLGRMNHMIKPYLSFIDGDHSFKGCWSDVQMVYDTSRRPGALVMLHDIVACDGVKQAWLRGMREGLFEPVAEFVASAKPLGIGIGRWT